ncbi:MAG: DUF1232 domain-containing protein, partial [Bdellovibrionales bacterium]|nr:DUF1232 domain-containing protein [Bdellovibrionales bacterium]
VVGEGLAKANLNRGSLKKIWGEFLALLRLLKAWASGSYRAIPWQSIVWVVAALLYFLNPIDAIPDILPGGFIDDIAVLTLVINRIRSDLDKFLSWEKSHESGGEPPQER